MRQISMNEIPHPIASTGGYFWTPRKLMISLVIAHLCLAGAVSTGNTLLESSLLQSGFAIRYHLALAWPLGFQMGQLILVVCWCSFAGQPWYLRIPRFLLLLAWLFRFEMMGIYFVRSDLVEVMVEEYAAFNFLMLLSPLLVLNFYGLCSGSRFRQDSHQRSARYQFSTRSLLLITAELSALLGLGRVVMHWNRNGVEEFWSALSGYRPEELMPVVISLTVLPAAFHGLSRQRTWLRLLFLNLYLALPPFVMAWSQVPFIARSIVSDQDVWLSLLIHWLYYYCAHLSAAATILLTFWTLRRIGYDFRRRDELPRAGSASNANSSAASAAA